jgi:very-short-patch-repair endonuclease
VQTPFEGPTNVEKLTPLIPDRRTLDLEVAIERVAASQHGVVTVAQLGDAGFTAPMIQRRVRKGRFAPLHRGVYRVGVGHFPLQAEMAAVLVCGPGSVLSHRSAAALWGLMPAPDRDVFPPHVIVPRSRRGATVTGIFAHRAAGFPDSDRTVHQGIPVTTPARTLLDLAALAARGLTGSSRALAARGLTGSSRALAARGVTGSSRGLEAQRLAPAAQGVRAPGRRGSGLVSGRGGSGLVSRPGGSRTSRPPSRSNRAPPLSTRELEQAVARAQREGLVNLRHLRDRVETLEGRAGAPLLRRILDAEGGPAFTRSEAERRLLDLIRRAKLPRPATNARVGPFEVDFLWRGAGLAVEVDGYAFHGPRDRFEADRARDVELAAGGIQVLRITWRHIKDQPEVVLVRLAQALEQARRRATR